MLDILALEILRLLRIQAFKFVTQKLVLTSHASERRRAKKYQI